MEVTARRFLLEATSSEPALGLVQNYFKDRSDCLLLFGVGAVWMNRQRVLDPNQVLEKGDTLLVYVTTTQLKKWELDFKRIVFENDDFLIVDKPSGVNTVPERSGITHNLTFGVQTYLKSQGIDYPSIAINRLDYGVRGLVLFSKNKASEKGLFRLIRDRKIKKGYLAVLNHLKLVSCLRVEDRLINEGQTRIDQSGKVSKSVFMQTQDFYQGYPVYRVVIQTGRRHQIRFHASHYLSPILGDVQYGCSQKQFSSQTLALAADQMRLVWKGDIIRCEITNPFEELG